jgi:hypothetical protein
MRYDISYLGRGVKELGPFIGKTIAEGNSGNGQESPLEAYRKFIEESLHYRLELAAYRHMLRLREEDADRKLIFAKNCDYRTVEEVIAAVSDYIMILFPYDDVIDNSPYRGLRPAYHLTHSPELVLKMYEEAKGRLLSLIDYINPSQVDVVRDLTEVYSKNARQEGMETFFKYDPDGEHNLEHGLKHLEAKALDFVRINQVPVAIATQRLYPQEWETALRKIFEATWLASDFFKNAVYPGVLEWIDIKTGRIPLPVVMALEKAKGSFLHDALLNVIYEIWHLYNPITGKTITANELEQLAKIDSSESARQLLTYFQIMLRDLNIKANVMQLINRKLAEAKKLV